MDFALSLLRAASGPKDNFVISPFSLGCALSIVHDGAKDDTQEELTRLLGMNISAAEVSALYSSLTSALAENSTTVITKAANRFFLNTNFSLKGEYQTHVKKAYNAGVESMNLSDGHGSANKINTFVEENTGGMIKELVTPKNFSDPNLKAVLINAVYFKSEWATQFQKNETRQKMFNGVKGKSSADFMIASKITTRYLENDTVTIVSLAYKDPSYSLVLLMPHHDFDGWRANLTADQFHKNLTYMRSGSVKLEVPKFKIESTTNGINALEKCGVSKIFNDSCDLSGISDEPGLYVSNIIHKAIIEVSEEGTEAAAATAMFMSVRSLPPPIPHLKFDKPFLYILTKHTGSGIYPLFIGAKVN